MLITIIVVCALWLGLMRHSNTLWKIISQQCIPNQEQKNNPAPCSEVNKKAGFVVYKDRQGPLQYLLIPTTKITGIESPELLVATTPNFFAQAWQARKFMANKYGSSIMDADISLAINSQYGRSQNQLHIHISCLSPKVKAKLANLEASFQPQWQRLPGGLLNHDYIARRVRVNELQQQGVFRLLAEEVEGAKENMGSYGLAMTSLSNGDFLLLATQRNLLKFNLASAEEIQDHQCQTLFYQLE
ncbi:CDP-diacylglycerol diphosphatase [Candidatus Fukatsuia symbiotica]|nr:CDP-diacylglycerol diphosphatase [Candidatus Fukatsuia symbiotica]MEA9445602.1 CDP-diacylglycerol diphosphatase [Candidatus Fukatsuia symbiotica]